MKQFCLFSALSLSFSAVHAQELSEQKQLAELANISASEAVFSKVKGIFAHDEKKISSCTTMGTPILEGITAFENPLFVSGAVNQAEWQVRYRVPVCGKQRLRTALFNMKNGNELSIVSLLPGSTQANMSLQADVRNSFFMAASSLAPHCQTPQIIQTQLTQAPESTSSSWQEIWTGNFCGTKVAQTIDFYPNEEGTAFTMTLVK